MRVRHIPNAKAYLENSKLVVSDFSNKGKWKTILNSEILNIEIGCGKGGYAYQMIQHYPDNAFVAIEKNPSIAYLALLKLETLESNKFRLMNFDAELLTEYFDESEVDNIYLNFSDPWPKKRTTKRRLSHSKFLLQYAKVLKPDGKIIMKTDNYPLFVYSLNSFVENGWEVIEIDTDFRSSIKADPITEYEQKFINKNIKINRLVVRRKNVE